MVIPVSNQSCMALGRNGQMFVRGLEVIELGCGIVRLTPINSKKYCGRCFIEIDKQAVQPLIDALTQMI